MINTVPQYNASHANRNKTWIKVATGLTFAEASVFVKRFPMYNSITPIGMKLDRKYYVSVPPGEICQLNGHVVTENDSVK